MRFVWKPGHCGKYGNEKADKVPRITVNNPFTQIHTYSSLIDIYSNVDINCTNLWKSELWSSFDNKLEEIKNTTGYWPKPHASNRKDKVIINRLQKEGQWVVIVWLDYHWTAMFNESVYNIICSFICVCLKWSAYTNIPININHQSSSSSSSIPYYN